MNKNRIIIGIILAIITLGATSWCYSKSKTPQLSDLALENLEALSRNETGEYKKGYEASSFQWYSTLIHQWTTIPCCKYNGNEYQYYIYGEVLDRINYLRSKSDDFDNIITNYLTSMGFDKKNGFATNSKQLSLLLDAGFDDIMLINRYKIEDFVRDNLIETNKYIDEYIKTFLNGYSNSMDCSIILINENIIRKLLNITNDCIDSKFSSKTHFYKMIEEISGEKINEDINNAVVEINKVI